jgi:hypothetical protein
LPELEALSEVLLDFVQLGDLTGWLRGQQSQDPFLCLKLTLSSLQMNSRSKQK